VRDNPSEPPSAALDRVRCLDCGSAYAKPARGGTVERNPGCPRCGYIGWVDLSVELRPEAPSRSAADRLPRLGARWH
jgi:hypothetical protein